MQDAQNSAEIRSSSQRGSGRAGTHVLRRRLAPLAIFALFTLGLGGTAARAGNPDVPFKSSIAGTVSPAGDGVHYGLQGAGNSSHLGRTAYRGDVVILTVDPISGDLTDVLTETLTAANGDTLTILCHQSAEQLSPGVYHGTDQWTVVGGTGRFSNATGSGTADTTVDLNRLTFAKQVTGTITSPK